MCLLSPHRTGGSGTSSCLFLYHSVAKKEVISMLVRVCGSKGIVSAGFMYWADTSRQPRLLLPLDAYQNYPIRSHERGTSTLYRARGLHFRSSLPANMGTYVPAAYVGWRPREEDGREGDEGRIPENRLWRLKDTQMRASKLSHHHHKGDK